VTSITPFGLDGPWADRPWSDLTLQAWSGGIWARGVPGRAPVAVPGRQDQWSVGITAAVATLAARIAFRTTGRGQLLDVSILEALCQWLFGYSPVTSFDIAGRPTKETRSVHIPGVEVTKDGWVGLMVGTAQQWFDFCAMVEHPEWIEDPSLLLVTTRSEGGSGISPAITQWTSQRTTAEIRELASAFRIPNAPVGNGETIPTLDHYVERGSYVRSPGGDFLQPDLPYQLSGVPMRPFGPPPRLGEHTEQYRSAPGAPRPAPSAPRATGATGGTVLPLHGVRVLDLTSLFAGPFATRVLGMLGAEVIHLESVNRPDLYRMYSLRTVGADDAWWEWTPGFAGSNTNKAGLTLNLQTPRGRALFLALVATVDVVVENFSARVIENFDLGYDVLRAQRPDLIMVRMPGFGLHGPWRDIPAFAPIVEDAAGITWLTGYPDDKPQEAQSVCDPNAALHAVAATLLALEHRAATGAGVLVEASMVDAAINIAAEQVVEFGALGTLLQRDGNRAPAGAPQGLYRAAELDEFGRRDCWVAIATESDDHWRHLCGALGNPRWARDPALATAAGRRAAHDHIDAELDAWCATKTSDEIVELLWSSGVPVGKVLAPHRQGDLPQLRARRFFETVDHPVLGPARYDTFGARFSSAPVTYNRRSAPTFGQDNHAILGELGCSPAELEELEELGVIGTEPTMGWRTKIS
jgi:crotonobetainyl-CoA:carnitine CoA-transferase CaiB-like acyl-CoA transferase